jgi:hypothetical protein
VTHLRQRGLFDYLEPVEEWDGTPRLLREPERPPARAVPLFDPGPAYARGYARARHFAAHPDAAEAAAVIRGALAEALEESFESGPLREVLWNGDHPSERARAFIERVIDMAADGDRAGIWIAFQRFGLDVFQAVALATCPEMYAADPLAAGIVPAAGPERVGVERLKAFAALLADVKGAAKSA